MDRPQASQSPNVPASSRASAATTPESVRRLRRAFARALLGFVAMLGPVEQR